MELNVRRDYYINDRILNKRDIQEMSGVQVLTNINKYEVEVADNKGFLSCFTLSKKNVSFGDFVLNLKKSNEAFNEYSLRDIKSILIEYGLNTGDKENIKHIPFNTPITNNCILRLENIPLDKKSQLYDDLRTFYTNNLILGLIAVKINDDFFKLNKVEEVKTNG